MRRFEARVGGHVRVKRARKQHLTVEAHAIQVAYPRWNIRETYAAGGTDLAAASAPNSGMMRRGVHRLLGAWTEGMGFEPAFDGASRRYNCPDRLRRRSQRGGGAGRRICIGQCFPHGRAERTMGIGIEYLGITLQHANFSLFKSCKNAARCRRESRFYALLSNRRAR